MEKTTQIQMTQLSKNIFKDSTGMIYVIGKGKNGEPLAAEPWERQHFCTACRTINPITSDRFTIGPKCPECYLKDSKADWLNQRKAEHAAQKKATAGIFAALKQQAA